MFNPVLEKDVAHYKRMSLLPKFSLVFERLLFHFLYEKIRHQIFPRRIGFQSPKSVVLQLLDFIEAIKFGKFEQQNFLYLDYAKAFHKLPLNVLLSKLSLFGLDDEVLDILSSYVNDRHQLVNFWGYLTNTIPVISRVPQRSVLDPLLLLSFINYLSAIFLDSIPWFFADDLRLSQLLFWWYFNSILWWNYLEWYFAKRLGLECPFDLKWTTHINNKINKARKPSSFWNQVLLVPRHQMANTILPEHSPINHPLWFTSLQCR